MNLFQLPITEKNAVQFLQTKDLLPARMYCEKNHEMKLYFGTSIFWKCSKSACRKKINIRHGNLFSNFRIPFVTTIRFFYLWAKELTSIKFCQEELGINKNTTVKLNNYMRQICARDILKQPKQKIGGVGFIVEIDESLYTKRKNNAGRVLPQQWIFGGLCRETKKCFLVKVPDRSAKTLLSAILENIEKGSVIYSDSWRSYKTEELINAGFEHFKVNHRYNFIDPQTSAHTQTIERLWGSVKWRNKKHRGTARHFLESYLAEFIWRQEIEENNYFQRILSIMK